MFVCLVLLCYGYYISVSSDAIVADRQNSLESGGDLIVDRYNLKLNVGDPGEVALVLLSQVTVQP